MKRKGAISLCLCVRVTEELRNVRKEGAVRRAIRQFDGNGCLQRERTETQNRFCVEPGILVIEMNRERLPVCNRGKLRDLVHGMEHDGKLSHGKSSCNGLYNRLEIQYNRTEKRRNAGIGFSFIQYNRKRYFILSTKNTNLFCA